MYIVYSLRLIKIRIKTLSVKVNLSKLKGIIAYKSSIISKQCVLVNSRRPVILVLYNVVFHYRFYVKNTVNIRNLKFKLSKTFAIYTSTKTCTDKWRFCFHSQNF